MKIKLTKELPTEVGNYYWAESINSEVGLLDVYNCSGEGPLTIEAPARDISVEEIGGYWAKVDQSMFEVVE